MLLEIQDLRCGYDGRDILRGVDLTVRAGECVGLLGPNGSGKTTLLRAVTRVVGASTGSLRIDGEPLERLPARALARRVAVVPQETSVAFPFTAAEVVEMGRYAHEGRFRGPTAADAAAVRRALERTRTLDLRDRPIAALSAGERQRVMLARAIAQKTGLLLVDEPTTHLDIRYQVEMLRMLRGLCEASPPQATGPPDGPGAKPAEALAKAGEGVSGSLFLVPGSEEGCHSASGAGNGTRDAGNPMPEPGMAVLAVLHDLNLALRFCTRVALLSEGRIVADGPPAEALTAARIREVFGAEVEMIRENGRLSVGIR